MSNPKQSLAEQGLGPPWHLQGQGLILILKKSSLSQASFGFDGGVDSADLSGKTRFLMIVDYQHSPCGSYQELLLIPGKVNFGGKKRWSISDIWVSSQESVDGGKANWGIPKQLGTFQRLETDRVTEEGWSKRICDHKGEVLLELAFQPMGPSLPFRSRWLPQSFLRMGQQLDGQRYFYDLSGNGRSRIAKVVSIGQTGGVFKGLSRNDVLAAIFVNPFEMVFPEPETEDVSS